MSNHPARQLPPHGELVQLARDDPEAYEALRRELIDDLIESAPDDVRPRLRGLQFRIDGVRRCAGSPLGAALKVYSLMWDSFVRLDQELTSFRDSPGQAPALPTETACIIEFRRRPDG